jgi:hypothetical protein
MIIMLSPMTTIEGRFSYEKFFFSSVSVIAPVETGNLGPLKGAELDPRGHADELGVEHTAGPAKGGLS